MHQNMYQTFPGSLIVMKYNETTELGTSARSQMESVKPKRQKVSTTDLQASSVFFLSLFLFNAQSVTVN